MWSRISLGLLLVATVAGCQTHPEDPPILYNDKEADATLQKAIELSSPALAKAYAETPLSDAETKNVKEAIRLWKGLYVYDGASFLPSLGLGQCYWVLGNDFQALLYLDYSANRTPKEPNPETKRPMAEIHHLASLCLFRSHKYDDALKAAETCIKLDPTQSSGYAAQAAALLQLKRDSEAKAAILEALARNGDDVRAKRLLRLFK